jgi:hypothetical protein
MDRTPPPGFKFHQGLDGLLLGLAIVFIVRLQMVISSLIDWRIVPPWTYVPVKRFVASVGRGVQSAIGSLSSPFSEGSEVVGGTGGSSAASGGGAAGASSIDLGVVSTLFQGVGAPVALFDALDASLIEQLLIIVGFWIAFLVPLWFWGLRPLLFWWRSADIQLPEIEA